MSAVKDGGPAFPRAGFWSDDGPCATDTQPQGGMSLRDWFAGQALVAIIQVTSAGLHQPSKKHGCRVVEAIALDAYEMADAMIAARGEP
jgi:hypothetical protein